MDILQKTRLRGSWVFRSVGKTVCEGFLAEQQISSSYIPRSEQASATAVGRLDFDWSMSALPHPQGPDRSSQVEDRQGMS